MPDPPIIIDTNVNKILQELIADYQSRTGRILQPAQVETLFLNSWAYREGLLRSQIQQAAVQNLVDFAVSPILDYLGRLVGVNRLGSSAAQTTLRFMLIGGHGTGTIPEGIRVASVDNQVFFTTLSAVDYSALDSYVEVQAQCNLEGIIGNGYQVGSVSNLMDAMAVVISSANTTITSAGVDQEADESLRERIKLAPSSFSTAGSRQAYMFFARSVSPSITDVWVPREPETPGIVKIYPKISGGNVTPQPILDAVGIACSAENVRPLCDTVQVESPTVKPYAIEARLTLFNWADDPSAIAAVEKALELLALEKREKLGQDVLESLVIKACMQDQEGVYNVDLNGFQSVIVGSTEFANCTSIVVTVIGHTDG